MVILILGKKLYATPWCLGVKMSSVKGSHIRLIISSIAIFIAAFILFILLWYFIMLLAPIFLSTFTGVTEVGRPTGGTQEILKMREQLSVVVLRWGLIPVFIGGIGDLTSYYIAYSVIIALLLAWRVKKRW